MPAAPVDRPALRTESLLRLAWPIFLQNMSTSAVMLVDFYYFSRISDAAAGTVGQLMPLFGMGAFVLNVLAGSATSVASQFLGAGQHEKVIPAYMANLALTGGLGLGYALLMWALASHVGGWMGMGPEIAPIAESYLSTICLFFAFHGVMVAYNSVLSSRGMTHWLMYTSFAVAGVNFALDPFFAFGLGWGVRGVAAASVVGSAVAAALAAFLVHRRLGVVFEWRGALAKIKAVFPLMARVGFSNSLEPFSYTCQQTLVSTFVIAMGVTSMAANNYALRGQMLQITFAFSLASGTQILAAHWMGAGRTLQVDRLFWRTLRLGVGVAFFYAFLLWQAAPVVLQVFTDDPEILALASELLLISLVLEPSRAVNIIGGITLKTVGDTRFPMLLGFAFIWGLLPVIFGLDRLWHLSLKGLWMCFAADELVRAIINAWRWKTGRWRQMAFVRQAASVAAPEEALPLVEGALEGGVIPEPAAAARLARP